MTPARRRAADRQGRDLARAIAALAALDARRTHGEGSIEYREALAAMDEAVVTAGRLERQARALERRGRKWAGR